MDYQVAVFMGEDLIKKHLPNMGWKLHMNHRLSAVLGHCNYRKRTICLNPTYVRHNSVENVRDTILHEIAHALTPNDRAHGGHGREWREACVRVGAKPNRYASADEVVVKHKYQLAVVTRRSFTTHIERLPHFSNRRNNLENKCVMGRPETLGRLEWLPVDHKS